MPCVARLPLCFKLLARMHMHCAHAVVVDQTPTPIRATMQCLSVPCFAVFTGPTGLHVVLCTFGIALLRQRVACLDVCMFFAGSALDWRCDNAGIDDLSATRKKACSLQLATDRRADGFHQRVLLQTRTPEPDGFGSRDLSAVFSPQDRLNAAPVQQLIRQCIV